PCSASSALAEWISSADRPCSEYDGALGVAVGSVSISVTVMVCLRVVRTRTVLQPEICYAATRCAATERGGGPGCAPVTTTTLRRIGSDLKAAQVGVGVAVPAGRQRHPDRRVGVVVIV